jgi:hypothetical protein
MTMAATRALLDQSRSMLRRTNLPRATILRLPLRMHRLSNHSMLHVLGHRLANHSMVPRLPMLQRQPLANRGQMLSRRPMLDTMDAQALCPMQAWVPAWSGVRWALPLLPCPSMGACPSMEAQGRRNSGAPAGGKPCSTPDHPRLAEAPSAVAVVLLAAAVAVVLRAAEKPPQSAPLACQRPPVAAPVPMDKATKPWLRTTWAHAPWEGRTW